MIASQPMDYIHAEATKRGHSYKLVRQKDSRRGEEKCDQGTSQGANG